jgi:glycosyltransferase involved in cell wall biosynthesis
LKILHTAPGLWTETGGPASSIPALCEAQAGRGSDVVLLTGSGDTDGTLSRTRGVRVEFAELGPYSVARFSPDYRTKLSEEAARAQIIHTHGIWLFPNWQSVSTAASAKKPAVVSPRGMLQPWAVRRSRFRKKVAWYFATRRMFDRAALVHASSSSESRAIRDFGISSPIVEVPNGVDLEGEFSQPKIGASRSQAVESVKKVVFLGRVHPVKGIDLLLEAWQRLGLSADQAELVIAGPGEAAEVAKLSSWLRAHRLPGVQYIGPVQGRDKLRLLTSAWTLVCPSWSESYGMVVAEALACATPVLATTGTPWQDLNKHECGWWVEQSVEHLASALSECIQISAESRKAMGKRGRDLVERHHSVSRSAERLLAAYSWVLGTATKPDFVDCV